MTEGFFLNSTFKIHNSKLLLPRLRQHALEINLF